MRKRISPSTQLGANDLSIPDQFHHLRWPKAQSDLKLRNFKPRISCSPVPLLPLPATAKPY
ncbi:hypothetical protein GBA52_012141 [Prunus armeniaca]|nr:hypothetical protein GBA52_012141 [Prunus armeniaca]